MAANPSTTGLPASYLSLLNGPLQRGLSEQASLRRNENRAIEFRRQTPPMVTPGWSRGSALVEVLENQELLATDYDLPTAEEGEAPPFDHSNLLNPSEKRLVYEWIDLGAPFSNQVYQDGAEDDFENGARYSLTELESPLPLLSQEIFEQQIHESLMTQCAHCHRPIGSDADWVSVSNDGETEIEPAILRRAPSQRFLLTGNAAIDFNAVMQYINPAAPENSPLLTIASATPDAGWPVHPYRPEEGPETTCTTLATTACQENDPAVLLYQDILAWITAAADSNQGSESVQ